MNCPVIILAIVHYLINLFSFVLETTLMIPSNSSTYGGNCQKKCWIKCCMSLIKEKFVVKFYSVLLSPHKYIR